MAKKPDGCARPAAGPIGQPVETEAKTSTPTEGTIQMQAKVGQSAPDFEATAYVNGAFENVKLSDYKGKWITLCFYPGDFTFV